MRKETMETLKKAVKKLHKAYKTYAKIATVYILIKQRGLKKLDDMALIKNAGELMLGESTIDPVYKVLDDLNVYYNPYLMIATMRSIAFVNPVYNYCVVDNIFMEFKQETLFYTMNTDI